MDGEDQLEEIPVPEGYQYVARFCYPTSIFSVVYLLKFLIGISFEELARWGVIAADIFQHLIGWQLDLVVLAFIFAARPINGLIQQGICRLLGYTISSLWAPFLYPLFGPFVVASGQYQSSRDALLATIAPASLYLFLLFSCFLMRNLGFVDHLLICFSLINLAGTISDLYFACWLLRKANKAVLYIDLLTIWALKAIPNSA